MDVSFGTIWEAIARDLPDAVAISEPTRDYTFAEFDDRAARLAAALPRTPTGKLELARVRGIASEAISASGLSSATDAGSN